MDYHRNMDHYYQSKRTLFQELIQNFRENPNQKYGAIINVNDPFGRKLADWMREEEPSFPVWCFGGEKDEIEIVHCNLSLEGYQAKVRILKNEYLINSPVLGRFNAWNHTVILAALLFYGVSSEIALATLENITPVPGRMEVYRKQNKTAVVDYAHTPDALENALNSLKELNPHRLYVIFGCGGDRDREKRPLMGKIATQLADYVTITNDNPRTENPENIFQDICLGITSANFQVVSDRKEAIVKALKGLSDDDVLLIAGKGHEDYQILGSQKIHFSDAELVREFL
jgi:UDP-N-acetylmuramoyl-L-alanyl-D-glutamate--2,6-diaminopimelate ligase